MTPTKERSAAYRGRQREKLARLKRYEEALKRIACFQDKHANEWLESEGTFSGFDEPGSVSIAREALK